MMTIATDHYSGDLVFDDDGGAYCHYYFVYYSDEHLPMIFSSRQYSL
jgi:hypothetical protein